MTGLFCLPQRPSVQLLAPCIIIHSGAPLTCEMDFQSDTPTSRPVASQSFMHRTMISTTNTPLNPLPSDVAR